MTIFYKPNNSLIFNQITPLTTVTNPASPGPLPVSTTLISPTTSISILSDGQTLPQPIVNVMTTTGFATSGTFDVISTIGTQTITYTGITPTSFTGCSGGTGIINAGAAVTIPQLLPQGVIYVRTTAGFASSGTVSVQTTFGMQIVMYTGVTANAFTGCTGGVGTIIAGGIVTSPGQNWINYGNGVYGVYFPATIISTLGIFFYTVQPSPIVLTTSITSPSNGQSLPQSIINVSSTSGFPATGTLIIQTSSLYPQTVNYTGTTSTTFTGCTGGTGILSTGGLVSLSIATNTFTPVNNEGLVTTVPDDFVPTINAINTTVNAMSATLASVQTQLNSFNVTTNTALTEVQAAQVTAQTSLNQIQTQLEVISQFNFPFLSANVTPS